MEFGVYTFVETRRDPATGEPVDVDKTFAELMEQIELADRVGLDVFGLGEHHRPDYAVSAPAVALAAAAARTKRIRLDERGHGALVRRSGARLPAIRHARPASRAGAPRSWPAAARSSNPSRCSATTSTTTTSCSPRSSTSCSRSAREPPGHWQGRHRAPLNGQGVYPRALQQPLPVWIASGGTPQSVARAGALGLPLAIAIIGGEPARFAPLAELYREAGAPRRRRAGEGSSSGSTAMASSPTRPRPRSRRSSALTPR